MQSVIYTTAHGNAGFLSHWVRPRIEPASSWIPVRFVTSVPPWELPDSSFQIMFSFEFSGQSHWYSMFPWMTMMPFLFFRRKKTVTLLHSYKISFFCLLRRNSNIGCLFPTLLLEYITCITSWQPQWATQWSRMYYYSLFFKNIFIFSIIVDLQCPTISAV